MAFIGSDEGGPVMAASSTLTHVHTEKSSSAGHSKEASWRDPAASASVAVQQRAGSAKVFSPSGASSSQGVLQGSVTGVEQGRQTGTAPAGDVGTRPNKVGAGALVRTAAISRPDAWEVKVGTMYHPTFWWQRWEFELRKGRLRWWGSQEDFRKRLVPGAKVKPVGDIALVEGDVQWRVSCVPGSAKLMLTCYRGASFAVGGEAHTFSAKDEREAREWTEAIEKHILEIDKLLHWPLPIDGRQGDVRKYGIDYPLS